MDSSLLVFTVTDQPDHPGCVRLKKSAAYWGWDLKVQHQIGWERSTYKAEQLGQLEALRDSECSHFLYLDAWDTMFAGPPGELELREGLSFCGDPLLGEWQHGRAYTNATHFTPAAFPSVGWGEFRYVNAGVIWGRPLVLRELAGDYLQNYSDSINQDYFNQRLVFERSLHRPRLRVDAKAEVALNLINIFQKDVERKNNRLVYLPTGSRPLVVHSPGTGITDPVAPMPQWMEALYNV